MVQVRQLSSGRSPSCGNLLCQVVGFFIAYNAYVRFDFDEVNGIWAVDYAVSNDLKKVLMQVQGVVLWPMNLFAYLINGDQAVCSNDCAVVPEGCIEGNKFGTVNGVGNSICAMGKDRNALAFRMQGGGRQINGCTEFGNVFASGSLLNVAAIRIGK